MAVIKPWAMNALNGTPLYDAPTLRNHFGALLHAGRSATLPLPGVLDPRALAVDVSSDPTVVVSAGPGVVVTSGGGYGTGLDGAWTGTLAARHATLSRIDRVILEVLDTTTQRTAQVRIITGTAAATPSAPALPASALSLATIAVPSASGGQATATDTRLSSAAAGGIIRVPDNAARLRVSTPPAGVVQYVSQEDAGTLWQRVGTAWSQVFPVPTSDTGWTTTGLVYGTGWTSAAAGQWQPFAYRLKDGVCYLNGVLSKSTWPIQDTAVTLPVAARPRGQFQSPEVRVLASGQVAINAAGASSIGISMQFPVG